MFGHVVYVRSVIVVERVRLTRLCRHRRTASERRRQWNARGTGTGSAGLRNSLAMLATTTSSSASRIPERSLLHTHRFHFARSFPSSYARGGSRGNTHSQVSSSPAAKFACLQTYTRTGGGEGRRVGLRLIFLHLALQRESCEPRIAVAAVMCRARGGTQSAKKATWDRAPKSSAQCNALPHGRGRSHSYATGLSPAHTHYYASGVTTPRNGGVERTEKLVSRAKVRLKCFYRTRGRPNAFLRGALVRFLFTMLRIITQCARALTRSPMADALAGNKKKRICESTFHCQAIGCGFRWCTRTQLLL